MFVKKINFMKKIKLSLTGVGSVLTEAAEKKLEEQEDYQVPKCNNGYTVEFYDDLGVNIPPELEAKLKQQDKGVELEDQDFEEVYSDVSVYESDILLMVQDEDLTTIFLRDSDIKLTVLETVEKIDSYIDYLSLSGFQRWWVGFKTDVSNFFVAKNNKQK